MWKVQLFSFPIPLILGVQSGKSFAVKPRSTGRRHSAQAGDYSLSAGVGKGGQQKEPPYFKAVVACWN